METKICTKCDIEYPATEEYFKLRKQRKNKLNSWCKECTRAAIRNWNKRNKEYKHNYYKKYINTIKGCIVQLINNIKKRCNNPEADKYKWYGGRGIKCNFTFDELYDWVIINNIDPRGLEIHRIDNNGNYVLGNIEFLDKNTHIKKHHPNTRKLLLLYRGM